MGKLISQQDADLEKIMIATLVDVPKSYDRLPEYFRPEHFEYSIHQKIMRLIVKAATAGEAYTWTTIYDSLKQAGELINQQQEGYFQKLMTVHTEATVLDIHAKRLIEKARQRDAVRIFQGLEAAFNHGKNTQALIEQAAQDLLSLTLDSEASSVERLSDTIQRYKQNILNLIQMDDQQRLLATQGLSTGLADLDKMLNGGLKPGQMVVIAARPGMGKSLLGMNIMRSISRNAPDLPVLFFSLEMTKDNDLVPRFLADALNIPLTNLVTARMEERDVMNWQAGINSFNDLNVYLDDSTSTIDGVRIESRKLAARFKGKMGAIFVDYLQLMTVADQTDRYNDVSRISSDLKKLAKALKCPVIALSQLSRKCEERRNKRPITSDLRESGQIEQDADIIMLLYRDDVYAKTEMRASQAPGICEVIVAKHRNGSSGTVHTHFNGAYQRLEDLDPHHYGDDHA